MTAPPGFDPAGLLAQAESLTARLEQGLATVRALGPVEPGATPSEVVHARDKVTLRRFLAPTRREGATPVLIVYALVNRPYIADLETGRSFVGALLDAGLDVYLLDWGEADESDRARPLADYVDGYLGECVEAMRQRHAGAGVNLLGICQGGTFSLCFTALHPERVRNLVTMVTPVDFHTPDNVLAGWVRHVDVDLLVDTLGNVPGELLNEVFLALKPMRLGGQKYLDMLELMPDPARASTFLRMERWIRDSPSQPGEAFRAFVKDLYQENRLVRGTMRIGGRPVDLARIECPVLNIYAESDHIVPPSSSIALRSIVGSRDYSEHAFAGGHIGIYVSAGARTVPPHIARWLEERG